MIFLHLEAKELLPNKYRVARLDLDLSLDLDEGSVAAALISEDETASSSHDTRVPPGHEAVVWESNRAVASSNQRIVIQVVYLARLSPFHNQMQPSPEDWGRSGHRRDHHRAPVCHGRPAARTKCAPDPRSVTALSAQRARGRLC
jgi:hypothetical protein